jgi:hypothetical protein
MDLGRESFEEELHVEVVKNAYDGGMQPPFVEQSVFFLSF